MKNSIHRYNARQSDQLRDIKARFDLFGYACGSVLFEMGKTKVLCSVNLQPGVPPFLKGKKVGWLTAEYAMLPSSTLIRSVRESSSVRRNGRSVEISRLIGRSLRTIVDFDLLGERTIIVDCDVLQADGGTRTACITGACLALRVAEQKWLHKNIIKESILNDAIAAVSVGVVAGTPLLDLDFSEDSKADADFNFVITKSNKLVEIQGASEGATISWDQFEEARIFALHGIKKLFEIGDDYFNSEIDKKNNKDNLYNKHTPFFSLKSRQNISCKE